MFLFLQLVLGEMIEVFLALILPNIALYNIHYRLYTVHFQRKMYYLYSNYSYTYTTNVTFTILNPILKCGENLYHFIFKLYLFEETKDI